VTNMHSKKTHFFKIKIQQAGFSLIELMVAMVISLTIIFACTALYSSLKSSISTAQDLATAQESLRNSFYLLSRSLRQAESFSISDAELTTTYGPEATVSNIYSCLGNDRILDNKDVFFKKEDRDGLYCYDDGDDTKAGAQLIGLGVSGLQFKKINENGVKVFMEIAGMPESMETTGDFPDVKTKGLTFTLALRQKILSDLVE